MATVKIDQAAIDRLVARKTDIVRAGTAQDIVGLNPAVPPLPNTIATSRVFVLGGVIYVKIRPSPDLLAWMGQVSTMKQAAGISEG